MANSLSLDKAAKLAEMLQDMLRCNSNPSSAAPPPGPFAQPGPALPSASHYQQAPQDVQPPPQCQFYRKYTYFNIYHKLALPNAPYRHCCARGRRSRLISASFVSYHLAPNQSPRHSFNSGQGHNAQSTRTAPAQQLPAGVQMPPIETMPTARNMMNNQQMLPSFPSGESWVEPISTI